MKVAILQSNYIPWKGYFHLISRSDHFLFLDEVQYTKNDWRNRNLIPTPSGLIWLTVPVLHKRLSKQLIHEARIKDSVNWQRKHWNAIRNTYSKAQHFNEIADLLHDAYFKPWTLLSDLNQHIIKKICVYLGIRAKISDTRELAEAGLLPHQDKNERLLNLIGLVGGTSYISGPSAKSYLDLERFRTSNIHVEFMDYSAYRQYDQRGKDFHHQVSILDLLFRFGRGAGDYIWKGS